MGETSKTTESVESAGSVPIHRPTLLVAIGALIAGPRKRIFLIAGTTVLVLMGLMIVAALAVSHMRKPGPAPAQVSPERLLQERVELADKKSGVEERFEAMKRGDFTRIQANRKVKTVTNAPSEATKDAVGRSHPEAELSRPVPQTRRLGNDPALAEKLEKEAAPGTVSTFSSATARSPTPGPTTSGCDVGASDPKASAAAILACILEFNAMDSRERLSKPPVKKAPGN